METKIETSLKILDSLVDKFDSDSSHVEDVLFYSLFLSIYDIAFDVDILIKNGRSKNSLILIRSLLETFVNMALIAKDKNFIHLILLDSSQEELKKLNSYLANVRDEKEFILQVTNRKKYLEEDSKFRNDVLNKLNFPRKISIEEKFKKTDLGWLYGMGYRDLCSHSHNNIIESSI